MDQEGRQLLGEYWDQQLLQVGLVLLDLQVGLVLLDLQVGPVLPGRHHKTQVQGQRHLHVQDQWHQQVQRQRGLLVLGVQSL